MLEDRPAWQVFSLGFLAGLLLLAAVIGGTFNQVRRQGVPVAVDVGAVSAAARQQIEVQVADLIPDIIEDMKANIPAQVADELTSKLGSASFSLFGVNVRLPADSLQGIRQQIQTVVTHELTASLDSIDIEDSSVYWGEQGEALVAQVLEDQMQHQQLVVQLWPAWPWLQVPVLLQVKSL